MYTQLSWKDLDQNYINHLIGLAKEEDLNSLGQQNPVKENGDLTSQLIPVETHLVSKLVARKELCVSGLYLIENILNLYKPKNCKVTCELHCKDGDLVKKGNVLANISGSAQVILSAERVILNFIQKLSGIATLTQTFLKTLEAHTSLEQQKIKLCDTRKTTPGFRMLEKYAVSCGGAYNHRLGLNHWSMFKDNHLNALGLPNLSQAAEKFRVAHPNLPIEIEVDNLEQLEIVLKIDPNIILLDNFSIADTLIASQKIRSHNPSILIEVSGNVSLETLPQLANLPIDIISTGAITHQSVWVDIGLD